MPSYHQQLDSEFSTIELFDLVADIEKYPEFLPWCAGARILSQTEHVIVAELLISFGIFKEKYSSKVILNRPQNANEPGDIKVELLTGPFKYLNNEWLFLPHTSRSGTKIEFQIDFCFRSDVLEKLIGSMFNQAIKKMASAFENRAKQIYASQN